MPWSLYVVEGFVQAGRLKIFPTSREKDVALKGHTTAVTIGS